MNGRDLTLGALAGLAVAGLVVQRRRASRNIDTAPLRYTDAEIDIVRKEARTESAWFQKYVRAPLDDFFRTEFYSDPTDVFGKTQSQRQFITMPSTSIPNDQDSYQNWLYRIPGKTCKEGGREACLPGTDGGPIPWLNSNPS